MTQSEQDLKDSIKAILTSTTMLLESHQKQIHEAGAACRQILETIKIQNHTIALLQQRVDHLEDKLRGK